jgi:hypothetical protein
MLTPRAPTGVRSRGSFCISIQNMKPIAPGGRLRTILRAPGGWLRLGTGNCSAVVRPLLTSAGADDLSPGGDGFIDRASDDVGLGDLGIALSSSAMRPPSDSKLGSDQDRFIGQSFGRRFRLL